MLDESVTNWIHRLKKGDQTAVQKLWDAYFPRLVQLARNQLQGLPRAASDGEDVALSAFKSCCLRAEQGKLPQLVDRDDLWHWLVRSAENKAKNVRKWEGRQKRDWRSTVSIDALGLEGGTCGFDFLELVSAEPDPAMAAEVIDQCRHLLDILPDDTLRTIALRKLEGYTNNEIAKQVRCAEVTIGRKLNRIRKIWKKESES
jgi:DNA-directed RNA polymerase specialized sigma24 family protein